MAQTGPPSLQFVNETNNIIAESNGGLLYSTGVKRSLEDSDSDDSASSHSILQSAAAGMPLGGMPMGMAGIEGMEEGPKPGKKTKGRVKIKMEFIENKLRRYTTFSKRKTGIMKKAYELSTLTGTQVMLLVASETGHVYTFATRKLQPMITSDSGKALIQTCLNSPDGNASIGATPTNDDQRMNPTGFEEPELSYGNGAISEDDHEGPAGVKMMTGGAATVKNLSYSAQPAPPQAPEPQPIIHSTPSPQPPPPAATPTLPVVQQPPPPSTPVAAIATKPPSPTPSVKPSSNNVPVQFPNGNILVPQSAIAAGTPIAMATTPFVQGTANQPQSTQQQTMYRIPTAAGQMVSLPSLIPMKTDDATVVTNSTAAAMSNPIVISGMPASAGGVTGMASAPTQGTVMYQTPQGVVYAASPSSLPEGYNFIVPQTPVMPTREPQAVAGAAQQQFITIPVSSLTSQNQRLIQATPTHLNATDLSKPK